jgi:hypothetical protein
MEDFTPGIYRHFKNGALYYAFGVAPSSETRTDPEVFYYSYEKKEFHRRPLAMWAEWVDRPEHSYRGPRFTLLVAARPEVPPPPSEELLRALKEPA